MRYAQYSYMKICRLFAVLSIFIGALLCSIHCSATDIYIAQVAQGADNGTNTANAHSVAWFNTAANWGGGAAQIGPGSTVHICGIVTNSITFQTGGSTGNPIVLLFEPNAKISAPTWSGSGNIITAASNVTIDGGSNGVIEATSNGTGLSYQNWCGGVYASCANNLLVKNLTIRNLYVRTSGGEQNGYGVGVENSPSASPYGYTNMVVTNCVIHDMYIGISCNYGTAGCSGIYIEGCSITNINWGVQCGDVTAGSSCDKVYIQNNIIGNFVMWDDPSSDSFHHNAAYCWAQLNSAFHQAIISGNTVFGYGNYNTSGFYFSGNSGSTVGMVGPIYIYNNIFNDQNGSPANGHVYLLPNAGFVAVEANNDFFGNSWSTALDWDAAYGGSQTVSFLNNIVSNTMAMTIYDDATATWSSDYNDFIQLPGLGDWFSASGNNSAGLRSLSTWLANGFDQHSLEVNPSLSSSFIPQSGSPLIDAGTNLYSIFNTDCAGNLRPATGAWTVGAYQYLMNMQAPLVSFTGSPLGITNGQTASLIWSVVGATNVILSGLGQVPSSGSINVTPSNAPAYTITAMGAGGDTTTNVIFLLPPSVLHAQ